MLEFVGTCRESPGSKQHLFTKVNELKRATLEHGKNMRRSRENAREKNVRFGSKVGQIGPKLNKSGTFSDQISVHFGSARRAKMY